MPPLADLAAARAAALDKDDYSPRPVASVVNLCLSGFGEVFAHHQGVNAIEVIARNGLEHGIAMALIKGQRGGVIHCGFQKHSFATVSYKALLGGWEQRRATTRAVRLGTQVNGENVPGAGGIGFGHNEAGDRKSSIAGHQCEGAIVIDKCRQFAPRISDSGGETLLIDLPQLIEILRLIGADNHRLIVRRDALSAAMMMGRPSLPPHRSAQRAGKLLSDGCETR